MSNYRFARLVMTTSNNNNKYYEMQEDDEGIKVTYGRVDSTATVIRKGSSQWNSLYNSKVGKGYKDVTEFVAVIKEQKMVDITYSKELYDIFLKKMMDYRDGLVSSTYSVKATQVTRKQLDQAQIFINQLNNVGEDYDTEQVNNLLLQLYTIIPRYMDKVQNYLLPNISLDKLVEKEQDKLDALSSQVIDVLDSVEDTVDSKLIADSLGIKISSLKDIPGDIKYIYNQLTRSVKGLFEVVNDKHFTKYINYIENKDVNRDGSVRHLIHGTRCSSVISIIEQGLKIRPSGNFHFSGKAYGQGLYFSELAAKSLGYTGYDSDSILLIYQVYVGNPFVYKGWFRGNDFELSYKELNQRGFDSTFVEAGNGLLNSELIIYKEEQCHLKYIIWL